MPPSFVYFSSMTLPWRNLVFSICAALSAAAVSAQTVSFTPLTDMGPQTYLGFSGGLYPDGNAVPSDHAALGLARAALVQPLDRNGDPSPSGKIALLSIGMSNTTQEFCSQSGRQPCDAWTFVGQALADPEVNHSALVFVNGARGGQTADTFDSATDPNYARIRDADLASAGLTEAQVQVAWVKVANAQPTRSLPAPDSDAYTLLTQTGDIVRALKARYPNVRLVYFSSRIYAGFASSTLNPEPYAYESGLAVKWLVQAQIGQARSGAVDPRAGDLDPATAPWIGWGAYLWGNGLTPRSDGLTWQRADFQSDGTHPSQSGEQKVGAMLLAFFKRDPTSRPWFLAAGSPPSPPAIDRRILPVVGSTPGANGTFFRTSVQIHNAANAEIAGRIVFHPSGRSASEADPTLPYSLAPGETRSIPDLLPAMGATGLGSADVLVTSGSAPVANVKVFNDAGVAGTTGFTEDAMRSEEALGESSRGALLVPADLVAYRFNIGIRTLDAGASVVLAPRDALGAALPVRQMTFPPSYHLQQGATEFVGLPLPAGSSITVTVVSGAAIVYGATVDNVTGDASLQIARAAP